MLGAPVHMGVLPAQEALRPYTLAMTPSWDWIFPVCLPLIPDSTLCCCLGPRDKPLGHPTHTRPTLLPRPSASASPASPGASLVPVTKPTGPQAQDWKSLAAQNFLPGALIRVKFTSLPRLEMSPHAHLQRAPNADLFRHSPWTLPLQ